MAMLSFPAVVSLFPAVALWLLQRSLCLVVVVGCHGWLSFPAVSSSFPRLHGRFPWLRHGCCSHCVLRLWLVVTFALFPAVVLLFPMVVVAVATIVMDVFMAVALAVVVVGCCG